MTDAAIALSDAARRGGRGGKRVDGKMDYGATSFCLSFFVVTQGYLRVVGAFRHEGGVVHGRRISSLVAIK